MYLCPQEKGVLTRFMSLARPFPTWRGGRRRARGQSLRAWWCRGCRWGGSAAWGRGGGRGGRGSTRCPTTAAACSSAEGRLEWTNRCRLLKFHAGKFLRLLIDTRGKAKIHFGCLPHPFFRQLHCHFVYFPLNQISGCLPHPRSTQETNKGDKMAKLKIIDLKKKFQCKVCEYATAISSNLTQHISAVKAKHEKVKTFKCKICPYAAVASFSLRCHITRAHEKEKKAPCKFCEYAAATLRHLERHVLSVHLNVKNYACQECGERFSQRVHLKKHNKSQRCIKSE